MEGFDIRAATHRVLRTQRRRLLGSLIAGLFVAALAGAVAVTTPASAGDGGPTITCSQSPSGCDLTARSSGKPGSGGGGGSSTCHDTTGAVVPCYVAGLGFVGSDGCYYLRRDSANPQPGAPMPGAWYTVTCGNGGRNVWLADGQAPGPAILAAEARAKLRLPRVVIELSPPGPQLTNLPVWLSLAASSWLPQSATASVPGLAVTATARPVKATWAMGDGSTVVCTGPGTAWRPGMDPAAASPDCGYTYRRSSAGTPGSVYTVTVTIAWVVTWSGGGQAGTIPGLTTTGEVQVQVQESQAIVTG